MSSWFFLPLYFHAVRGASPTRSGVLIMPLVVVQAATGVVAGGLTFRFGWIRPLIWTGMALTTLGFGLFISIGISTSLPVMIVFELIAALGLGMAFQAPLIAYQSVTGSANIVAATALFGFVRSISTTISVVIGGVVFQNRMWTHSKELSSVLGVQTAQNFSASTAATNVLEVRNLPLYQQTVVKRAYSSSLSNMWIMYACMGGLGLIAAIFVKHQDLGEARTESTDANNVELVQATN